MSSLSRRSSVSSVTSTAEGRKEPSSVSSSKVRLVLLGKTTTGKNSVANSILGRRAFKSNQQCRRACSDFHGRHIALMDTPASVDRQQTSEEVQKELRRCITLLSPGVNAFLLVLQIGRFTQEEREAVRLIQEALGPQALEYSVVVFTPGDGPDEGASARDCPVQPCEGLSELVAKCGGRYCTFSSQISKTTKEVAVLLNLVDSISEANGGRLYTCKTLRELCDDEEEEVQQESRLQSVKEELQKVEGERKEAMREWYQRELEKIQQQSTWQMEDLKRKQQMEREMEEQLCREREEAAGRERMEDSDKMEKERQIRDMARVTEIRKEEETKREALQEQLEGVIKTLQELRDTEGSMRREVGNIIQRHRVENEEKERQWQVQQLEREQTIRQREETKREALQNELDRLTQIIEEQGSREEKSARQRQELIRSEIEISKREKERALENQKEERKKRESLQEQLRLLTMRAEAHQQQLRTATRKVEEHKEKEATLKRELKESREQREIWVCEMCALREECNTGRSEHFDEVNLKWPSVEGSSVVALVRPVSGYPREMGILVLNAALETIDAPCCIQ